MTGKGKPDAMANFIADGGHWASVAAGREFVPKTLRSGAPR